MLFIGIICFFSNSTFRKRVDDFVLIIRLFDSIKRLVDIYLAAILIKESGIKPDSANDKRNLVICCITFIIFNLDKLLRQE